MTDFWKIAVRIGDGRGVVRSKDDRDSAQNWGWYSGSGMALRDGVQVKGSQG